MENLDRILILDFGSQYAQLIGRRVRDMKVYCELLPFNVDEQTIRDFKPKGIILSGGPESTVHACAPQIPQCVFELGCPVLGICYGMQSMAIQLGGSVECAEKKEFGSAKVHVRDTTGFLHDIADDIDEQDQSALNVWMSHGDKVTQLPAGFNSIAFSETTEHAAMADETRCLYGLQFHPEVTQTTQGERILRRFVLEICQCKPTWTLQSVIDDLVQDVRDQVQNERVILGLSGGVDSAVLAVLLQKAIGKQLTCIFVDTGLLRLDEAEKVQHTFAEHLGINVIIVNAQDRFFKALKGVTDPEEKRKVIGHLFIDVFQYTVNSALLEASNEALAGADSEGEIRWLAQGTIYPDVIESAREGANVVQKIKSHHNVGGLPEELPFKLLEPLRQLFKDEVRNIGLELGLPYHMVYRHPFPGPGLAVRILGEVKQRYADILCQADDIFMKELHASGWYDKVSQAFTVFLPVKSVGVVGDARIYEYVVGLRAVETVDFMTARWAHLPYELLERISNRIINEVPGVSRVVYDVSSKPPATIEWE